MMSCFLMVADESGPFYDPEWQHLGPVYQILLRLQGIVPHCPEFGIPLIKALLGQMGSPDERERDAICQFVQCFVISHVRSWPTVLQALSAALPLWTPTGNCMVAVSVVLSVYQFVLKELGSNSKATKPFFDSTILPLLTSHYFGYFHKQFTAIAAHLISVVPRTAGNVLQLVIRYWPHTRLCKQAAFIRIIALVLGSFSNSIPTGLIHRLFMIIACCITAPAGRVCDVALRLFAEPPLELFIRENSATLFPIVFAPIVKVSRSHWSPEVRDVAKMTLGLLGRFEPRLYHDLSQATDAPAARQDDRQLQAWRLITQAAVRRDPSIRLGQKMAELMKLFCLTAPGADGHPLRKPTISPPLTQNATLLGARTPVLRPPEVFKPHRRTTDS
jgi:hypothetical protein